MASQATPGYLWQQLVSEFRWNPDWELQLQLLPTIPLRIQTPLLPDPGTCSKELWDEPACSMCCKMTASPSRIPYAFRDFLLSIRGIPLNAMTISVAGNPVSTSQNALKFSNSKSSDTSRTKIKSVNVVTVTFILLIYGRKRRQLIEQITRLNDTFLF